MRLPQCGMSLFHPTGRTCGRLSSSPHPNQQVWQLDLALSYLETMTSQDRIQSRQIWYYILTVMSVVPKTAGSVSPDGIRTPPSPGKIIYCPPQPPEVLHRGSSLRYHAHQQGWTLIDACIKRASGQSTPFDRNETRPVDLHLYLYVLPTEQELIPEY